MQFFRQGDREKLLGLPISPLFDRDKRGITKSQVGFFDIVGKMEMNTEGWGSMMLRPGCDCIQYEGRGPCLFPLHECAPLSSPAVIPMYQTFSSVFPGSEPLLTYVMRNYRHWAEEQG